MKAKVLFSLGIIYNTAYLFDLAEEYYSETLTLFEKDSSITSISLETVHLKLGNIYYTMKLLERAKQHFLEALKLSDSRSNYLNMGDAANNLGLVHKALKELKQAERYYYRALKFYQKSDYHLLAALPLHNLGMLHHAKKKFKKAEKYFLEALKLYEQYPNPLESAKTYSGLGNVYYDMGKIEKAEEFYLKALKLYEQDENPYFVRAVLDNVHEREENLAQKFAARSLYGHLWLFDKFQEEMDKGNANDGKTWMNLWMTINKWWELIKPRQKETSTAGQWVLRGKEITKDPASQSKKTQANNWKVKQTLQRLSSEIIADPLILFLMGVNNLNSDLENNHEALRDKQRQLHPRWFVEIPTCLHHNERYLKIRLNGRIFKHAEYMTVPCMQDNELPPIKRIRVQLETQWLQKHEIDHVFLPNTKEEYEEQTIPDKEKTKKKGWLSEVAIMDLGSHVKKVDKLELQYQMSIYFDEKGENPAIRTTRQRIIIPIIRDRNVHKIDKIRHQHDHIITMGVATISIIISTLIIILQNWGIIAPLFISLANLIPIEISPMILETAVLGALASGSFLDFGCSKEDEMQ